MTKFRDNLLSYVAKFKKALESPDGEWSVKGFIDVTKNIYTISGDTKVISKIVELMMFPTLKKFADKNGYEMILAAEQNHYPDVTFITTSGEKIALDLKTTYRKDKGRVSGFTLGAFTGYFRERNSSKNITYPYSEYSKHFILGVIYSKQDGKVDESKVHSIDEIESIISVIKEFDFIVQEKYRIAKDVPGSGNTKNMGSCVLLSELKEGAGPFSKHGVAVFDDYWKGYMTKNMAKNGDLIEPPYSNLEQYLKYRNIENL